jgi:hypothetical protein
MNGPQETPNHPKYVLNVKVLTGIGKGQEIQKRKEDNHES